MAQVATEEQSRKRLESLTGPQLARAMHGLNARWADLIDHPPATSVLLAAEMKDIRDQSLRLRNELMGRFEA